MLDSPYVRRTAISLRLLGVPFEHRPRRGPSSGSFPPAEAKAPDDRIRSVRIEPDGGCGRHCISHRIMSLPPATPAPPSASPPAFDCEVLVVGGGPAGSTIAALLAERGRDVILAEKGRHPRFHIGESLLPANAALFERLGVRAEVERFGMTKYGAEFVSPDHEHRPMIDFAEAWDKSMPYAWQVRRSELDELLFRNAAAKGARAMEGCRIRKVEFDAEGGDGRGRARRRREADLAQPLPRRRDRPRHVAGEPVPQQGEEPQAQQLGALRPLSRRQASRGPARRQHHDLLVRPRLVLADSARRRRDQHRRGLLAVLPEVADQAAARVLPRHDRALSGARRAAGRGRAGRPRSMPPATTPTAAASRAASAISSSATPMPSSTRCSPRACCWRCRAPSRAPRSS